MGNTSYSLDARSLRAMVDSSGNALRDSTGKAHTASSYYMSASTSDIFTQQKERMAHKSMLSQNMTIRECRDSEAHPNAIPIILGLDVTGSMGHIPHNLIKTGLPTIMGTLIQNGVEDAALMFVAVGDHECDRYPLQVSQFESGDAELDMWLTRTYLEGGGGGNAGEGYNLAWQVAAENVVTDAWEKRQKKGFLITIGDEPVLRTLSKTANSEVFGTSANTQAYTSTEEILAKAQQQWNVYHIHVNHNARSQRDTAGWKELLGDHCIVVTDYTTIPLEVAKIVLGGKVDSVVIGSPPSSDTSPTPDVEVIL